MRRAALLIWLVPGVLTILWKGEQLREFAQLSYVGLTFQMLLFDVPWLFGLLLLTVQVLRRRGASGMVGTLLLVLFSGLTLVLAFFAQSAFWATGVPPDVAMIRYYLERHAELGDYGRAALRVSVLQVLLGAWVGCLVVGFWFRWRARRAAPVAGRFGWPVVVACLVLPVVLAGSTSHINRRPLLPALAVAAIADPHVQFDPLGTSQRIAPTPTALTRIAADPPLNVVLVMLESVRSQSTTIDRPDLPVTPFMASLATAAVVATSTYTIIPHTTKTLTPILCGYESSNNVRIPEQRPGGLPAPCLPALLTDHRSLFIQSATESFESRRTLVANMGFDSFRGLEQLHGAGAARLSAFSLEDEIMLPEIETWLEGGQQPFLLAVLTGAAHSSYEPVPGQQVVTYETDPSHPDLNRYLNNVRYTDWFVEQLHNLLRRRGLLESTLVVIVGDHGEAFSEHGMWGHGYVVYEEALKVPLIVSGPSDRVTPRIIGEPRSQLDIVPTIVDLLVMTQTTVRGADWH